MLGDRRATKISTQEHNYVSQPMDMPIGERVQVSVGNKLRQADSILNFPFANRMSADCLQRSSRT